LNGDQKTLTFGIIEGYVYYLHKLTCVNFVVWQYCQSCDLSKESRNVEPNYLDLAGVGEYEVEDTPQAGLATARLHMLHLVFVILILASP